MGNLESTIKVKSDSSGVETGLQAGKAALKDFGGAASDSGAKVEASTKSMIGSIQRTTAAMEAGTKTGSEYYKVLASQRGIDQGALKPYLDQLDAVKAKQDLANAALGAVNPRLNEVGMSAKQTSFALRGIPAQFTDIAVSLQGGQKPLTVLLQQGGQLKDMFGGIGPAAKAMGGYILGMINPITLTAAAVGTLGYAWYKGAAEAQEYAKAIILSGNAAGTTITQLQGMAEKVSAASGATIGASSSALAEFAANGNIASSQFEKLSSIAMQMEKTTGQAVSETVKQFAELGKEPLGASLKLNEATHFLTLSVYEQIKALTEQGKTLEAGAIAQNAYADAMNGRVPQLVENLGTAEKAWRGIMGAAKDAWDAMLSVGRDGGRAALEKAIAVREGFVKNNVTGSIPDDDKKLNALKDQLASLGEIDRLTRRTAESKAEESKQVQANVAWDKLHDQYLTKAEEKQRAISKATQDYSLVKGQAGKAEEYLYVLSKIEDKFKETRGTVKEAESEYDKLIKKLGVDVAKAAADAETAQNGYNKAQTDFVALARTDVWAKLTGAQKAQAAAMFEAKIGSEQLADSIKALAKADLDGATARDKFNVSLSGGLDKMKADTLTLQEQYDRLGLTKEAIASLDAKKLEDQAITLDGIAIKTLDKNLDYAQYEIYKQQSAELRAQAALKNQIGIKEDTIKAGLDAQKKVEEAWKHGWEETDRIAREAFTGWADGGKSAAEVIGAALKKALLSAIYEATIRPIAMNIYASIVGGAASGATGSAIGSAGGSALGSMAGNYLGLTGTGSFASGWAAASAASTAASAGTAGLLTGSADLAAGSAIAGSTAMESAGISAYGALGAVPVAGWIALAVVAAYEIFHKNFISAQNTGNSTTTYDASGAQTAQTTSDTGLGLSTSNGKANDFAASLEAGYISAARSLGIGTIATQFSYGSNTGREGANPNFTVSATAGGNSYKSVTGDASLFGANEVAMTPANVQLEAARAVFVALQSSTLPKYLSGVFDGFSAPAMTQQQITDVETLAQSYADMHAQLQTLPDGFKNVKDLTYQAYNALTTFSGGMQQLGTNMATYYSKFFSQAEQRAQTVTNVAATLDTASVGNPFHDALVQLLHAAADPAQTQSTIDALHAQFRTIAESLDLATTSGQATYAAMMSVAGAFDGLEPAAVAAAVATTAVADALKILTDTAKTNAGLQDQLDVLLGTRTQTEVDRANTLADITSKMGVSTDQATLTLQNQIYAQQDLKTAADEAVLAMQRMSASISTANDVRIQLGTTTAYEVAQGAAMAAWSDFKTAMPQAAGLTVSQVADFAADPANRAKLGEQDWAIVDKFLGAANTWMQFQSSQNQPTGAATSYAQSAATVDTVLQSLTSTNASLTDQYNKLTMSAQAYREFQIAGMTAQQVAMYDSNVSLQANIDAYNATTAAAATAASAWKSASDSIIKEIDRIRGVMAGTGSGGLAQAESAFAIATAQARANDVNALNSLPGLSQNFLSLAEGNAQTKLDLRRVQAQVAASLTITASRTVDPSNAELVAEIRDMKATVAQLIAQLIAPAIATAEHTLATRKTLTNVTNGGDGMNLDTPVLAL